MFSKHLQKLPSLPIKTNEDQRKLHAKFLEQQSHFSNPLMNYDELRALKIVKARTSKSIPNFQERTPPVIYKNNQILSTDIIKHFEQTITTFLIDLDKVITLWADHPLLSQWYGSEAVILDNLKVRTIPIFDLICLSQNLLRHPWEFKYILEKMIHGSLQLREWFKGYSIDLGNGSMSFLSFNDLFLNFQAILKMKHHPIIDLLFFDSPKLGNWFKRIPANLGTENSPYIPLATVQESINNFKLVLDSQCISVIEDIYHQTPLIQAWINGFTINYGSTTAPDNRASGFDELINTFRLVIQSKSVYLIEIMLKIPELRTWYQAMPINFGSESNPDVQRILMDDLLDIFKLVLHGKCIKFSEMMFDIPILQTCFKNLPLVNATIKIEDIRNISTKDLIKMFQLALKNGHSKVFETMFEIPKVQTWLKGLSLNFGRQNSPNWQKISPRETIANFQFVLKMKNKKIIEQLFDLSPLLKTWINDKPIDYDDTRSFPDTKLSTSDELRKLFYLALNSGSMKLITTMWEKNNRLIPVIQQLNFKQSNKLLHLVLNLNSISSSENNFIGQYINCISDIRLLKNNLNDLNAHKFDLKEYEISERKKWIEFRINALEFDLAHPELIIEKDKNLQKDNSSQEKQNNEKNRSRKRRRTESDSNKNPTQKKSKAEKKQNVEPTKKEISEFVKLLPLPFNNNKKLFIDKPLKLILDMLPKTVKAKMGIKYYKIKNKEQYTIKILDSQKYYAFLYEYSQPEFETTALINNPLELVEDNYFTPSFWFADKELGFFSTSPTNDEYNALKPEIFSNKNNNGF